MKIASWNVNSIKVRLSAVLDWVERQQPDVLLLQEIKTTLDGFPRLEFETRGYCCAVVGQRAYNGVAIVSREPVENVIEILPGDPSDDHARYVEASVRGLRVASIYLPNGNPVGTPKYDYKLAWMARLREHVVELLATGDSFVLGGDYNVIPTEMDVYHPENWTEDALFKLETRKAFRSITNLGLTDAFRALHPHQEKAFTFWDYQAGRWHRDEGLRIDHLLLSPGAADWLVACEIDKTPRALERASDHTPIWCELSDRPPGAWLS